MSEVLSTFHLKPGTPAPEFRLPDPGGRWFARHELSGPAGLLVVFACNHCPFVIHLAAALGELARELVTLGIHTVAINPNDASRHPQDAPELMQAFAKANHWDFPYLVDASQEVAKSYGAACTPDFFLFNGDGRLFYAGQFDDSRPRSGQLPHGGDLREAVRRMVAGEQPLARPYPSSGCNIKWKEGNRPDWWNAGG